MLPGVDTATTNLLPPGGMAICCLLALLETVYSTVGSEISAVLDVVSSRLSTDIQEAGGGIDLSYTVFCQQPRLDW